MLLHISETSAEGTEYIYSSFKSICSCCYRPVHETLVLIAYDSNTCSQEPENLHGLTKDASTNDIYKVLKTYGDFA